MNRRNFITKTAQAVTALSILGAYASCKPKEKELFFKISLAQWSLHQSLFSKKIDHLDFARIAREMECSGLEYVSGFFADKAKNTVYLNEMKAAAKNEGVQNVLIMVDGEGALAHEDPEKRMKTIENHYKWVDAAHHLGCHAIRVNLGGGKNKIDAAKAGIDSLSQLSEYASEANINVLVENHGGFSSDGEWMHQVFSQIKNSNCGTLPDFGNFCMKNEKGKGCIEEYDRYKGIKELLPFAKAVSAKSYDFDENGNQIIMDYGKILKMVKKSGYTGFIGIEYEGKKHSELEGIKLTRELLIKEGRKLS